MNMINRPGEFQHSVIMTAFDRSEFMNDRIPRTRRNTIHLMRCNRIVVD